MDSMTAFAMGEANRGREMKVFDWHKAAKLIAEWEPERANAGLDGDWEYTGGPIWQNGKPVPEEKTHVFLASTWATPQLDLDGEVIDCFVMETEANGWNEKTYWPQSALDILGSH